MKKQIILILTFIALALILPCYAQDADLIYDHSVIDFDHACDYYNVSANKDISSLSTPSITSRIITKGSVLNDVWEILGEKNITETTNTYKTICAPYTITHKNSSKEEHKNCTTVIDKTINKTKEVSYWTNYSPKSVKNKDIIQIRYCADFKRDVSNAGAKIVIDNIPTFYSKEYTKYVLWNSSINYYVPFNVTSVQTKDLYNYTQTIQINTATLIAAGYMRSNCSDIWIVDSNLVLLNKSKENNTCNTNRTTIFFNIPVLLAGETKQFYLFYGDNNSAGIDNDFATFPMCTRVVHGSDYSDVLGGLSLTPINSPTITNGKFGDSFNLNGVDEYFETNGSLGSPPFSMTVWINPMVDNSEEHSFYGGQGGSTIVNGVYNGDLELVWRDQINTEIFYNYTGTGQTVNYRGYNLYSIVIAGDGVHENYFAWNGTTYLNNTISAGTFNPIIQPDLGAYNNGGVLRFLKGGIDELRFYNVALDKAYIDQDIFGYYTMGEQNNNTNLTINTENLTLLASRFDRFNVSIANQSYTLVGNYTFTAPINCTSILVGSGYANKVSGAGTTNLNMKIVINNNIVYNDTLVSFSTTGEYRTFFLPKISTNVSNNTLTTLQIYFNVSNAAIVRITDFGIGLLFNSTGTNQTIIEYTLTPVNSVFSTLTYTNIGSKSTTSDIQKNLYLSFSGKVNGSAASLDMLYLQNNQTLISSPFFVRYLSSSTDVGVIGGATIQNKTTNQTFNLYANTTNGVSSTFTGNIFTLALNTSIGGIQSKSTSNNMSNFSNTITINATYYRIINETIKPRSNITNGLMIEFIGNFFKSGGNPVQDPIADIVCNMSNSTNFIDQKYVLRTLTNANPYANPKIMMFGTNFNNLEGQTINIDCYARNTGSGTLKLLDEVLNVIELTTFNLTYVNIPPTVTIIEPQGGTDQSGNFSLNWTITNIENSTVNVTLTNSTGWIQNIDNMTEANTSYNIDTGLYNGGLWSLGVFGCDSAGCGTDSIIVTFATTTTTTTTTSSTSTSSTTTTLPPGTLATNNTDEIYSIMLPIFAFISMIYVYTLSKAKIKESVRVLEDFEGNKVENNIGKSKDLSKVLLPPLLPLTSSLLWFMSSYTTINIKHFGNYTIIGQPYYVSAGNPEIGILFSALGVFMGIYFLFSILQSAKESGWIKGGAR